MKNETTEQMIISMQDKLESLKKSFEDDVERYGISDVKKQNFFNQFVLEQLAVLFIGVEIASGDWDKKQAKKKKKK